MLGKHVGDSATYGTARLMAGEDRRDPRTRWLRGEAKAQTGVGVVLRRRIGGRVGDLERTQSRVRVDLGVHAEPFDPRSGREEAAGVVDGLESHSRDHLPDLRGSPIPAPADVADPGVEAAHTAPARAGPCERAMSRLTARIVGNRVPAVGEPEPDGRERIREVARDVRVHSKEQVAEGVDPV